jgi:outer membrane immunogenic protein
MLRFTSLTAMALVLSVSAAQADDLSFKDAPSSMSWGGAYVGATIGYGWGSSETYYNNGGDFQPDADHPWASNDPSGALGGVTLGYNYQINDRWVAGIETDISMADISGTDHMYWGDGHYWQTGWDALFTLRARAGYTFGSNLVYGTVGLAAVDSNEYNIGDNANQSSDNTGWIWGWAIGAGVEHKFNDRWSAKAEYLHVEMSDKSGYGDNGGAYEYVNDLDLLRVGLNYKIH